MADSHALRDRYLKKVRATEYATKVSEGLISEDYESSEFSYSVYIKNDPTSDGMDDTSFSSQFTGSGGSSSSSATTTVVSTGIEDLYIADVANAVNTNGQYNYISIRTGTGDFYQTEGMTASGIADYKKVAKPTVDRIVISTYNYFVNGKIQLPTEDVRAVHAASMMKYIQSVGGVSKAPQVFAQITKDDFDWYDSLILPHLDGLYARKDFIIYLKELQRRVLPQLSGSPNKLTINSLYRHPSYDYQYLQPIAYWNGHLAGIAADIHATGTNRVIIANEAEKMGFGGIAIGKTFVHVDILGYGRWGYSGAQKYIGSGNPNISVYA